MGPPGQFNWLVTMICLTMKRDWIKNIPPPPIIPGGYKGLCVCVCVCVPLHMCIPCVVSVVSVCVQHMCTSIVVCVYTIVWIHLNTFSHVCVCVCVCV